MKISIDFEELQRAVAAYIEENTGKSIEPDNVSFTVIAEISAKAGEEVTYNDVTAEVETEQFKGAF